MVTSYVLYLALFKVSIVVCGIVCIVLGAGLFKKGVYEQNSSSTVEADIKEGKFFLRNAAPGTLFALFGAAIIVVMLYAAPPEVNVKTLVKRELPKGDAVIREVETTTSVLRSSEMDTMNKIISDYDDELITATAAVDLLREEVYRLSDR